MRSRFGTKNLDIERFRNLDIPVPPIEIQEKIIKPKLKI
ncbi:restriction endonuclease subunit S [Mesomycoplasma ovipneumoniae]